MGTDALLVVFFHYIEFRNYIRNFGNKLTISFYCGDINYLKIAGSIKI